LPERRASRFLVEALFLVGLAVGLGFAHVRPLVLAGVMLGGWVLSALFEWTGVRGEPHYGSGLPPQYYVPQLLLPPALPVERPSDFFPLPESPGEAQTWIVPKGETYDWPWLRESEPAEETQVVEVIEEATAVVSVAAAKPKAKPRPKPQPTPRRRPARASATPGRLARHRIDPLVSQASGRRRKGDDAGVVEVPARPRRRVLPGSAPRGE
jgi:hypothetical protein